MKMTERSQKWTDTVVANCKENTGRTLAAREALARSAGVKDVRAAHTWARKQGLSIVYQNAVAKTLFPSNETDDSLVSAQYSGAKAALRSIYDAVVAAAGAFGDDVEILPRKSQVTHRSRREHP
jgi:hypothetical protein